MDHGQAESSSTSPPADRQVKWLDVLMVTLDTLSSQIQAVAERQDALQAQLTVRPPNPAPRVINPPSPVPTSSFTVAGSSTGLTPQVSLSPTAQSSLGTAPENPAQTVPDPLPSEPVWEIEELVLRRRNFHDARRKLEFLSPTFRMMSDDARHSPHFKLSVRGELIEPCAKDYFRWYKTAHKSLRHLERRLGIDSYQEYLKRPKA